MASYVRSRTVTGDRRPLATVLFFVFGVLLCSQVVRRERLTHHSCTGLMNSLFVVCSACEATSSPSTSAPVRASVGVSFLHNVCTGGSVSSNSAWFHFILFLHARTSSGRCPVQCHDSHVDGISTEKHVNAIQIIAKKKLSRR